jgi:hypothetical protein
VVANLGDELAALFKGGGVDFADVGGVLVERAAKNCAEERIGKAFEHIRIHGE